MKKCPYCLKELQDTAVKCKYCRKIISEIETSANGIYPPWGMKNICAIILIGIIVNFIISFILSFFYQLAVLYHDVSISESDISFITSELYSLIFIILIYLSITKYYHRNFFESLRLTIPKNFNLYCTPLIALGLYLIIKLFPTPSTLPNIKGLVTTDFSSNLLIFSAIFIAPICEEIFWRGYVFPVVAKKLNIAMSILVVSLLFTLGHSWMYWGASYLLIKTFIGAIVFTTFRALTGSTLTSILIHFFNNLFAVIVVLFLK